MHRWFFVIIIGIGGAAILISLGVWQVQRLSWKSAILSNIEQQIHAPPNILPPEPDKEIDNYRSVRATGITSARFIRILSGKKNIGPGYRIIRAFKTDETMILLDQGFVSLNNAPLLSDEPAQISVVGNLLWPDEVDRFTPAPDPLQKLWYARDITSLAHELQTQPILLVARKISPPPDAVSVFPINTRTIPNNHLHYAITWFSLAVVWLVMSVYYAFHMHRQRQGN